MLIDHAVGNDASWHIQHEDALADCQGDGPSGGQPSGAPGQIQPAQGIGGSGKHIQPIQEENDDHRRRRSEEQHPQEEGNPVKGDQQQLGNHARLRRLFRLPQRDDDVEQTQHASACQPHQPHRIRHFREQSIPRLYIRKGNAQIWSQHQEQQRDTSFLHRFRLSPVRASPSLHSLPAAR